MNNELSIKLIEEYSNQPCPRCGTEKIPKQASSRRINTQICNLCGNLEGLEDAGLIERLRIDDWWVILCLRANKETATKRYADYLRQTGEAGKKLLECHDISYEIDRKGKIKKIEL